MLENWLYRIWARMPLNQFDKSFPGKALPNTVVMLLQGKPLLSIALVLPNMGVMPYLAGYHV